ELGSLNCGALDRRSLERAEPIEAGGEQGVDRRGPAELRPVPLHERGGGHLFEEERIAAGSADDLFSRRSVEVVCGVVAGKEQAPSRRTRAPRAAWSSRSAFLPPMSGVPRAARAV